MRMDYFNTGGKQLTGSVVIYFSEKRGTRLTPSLERISWWNLKGQKLTRGTNKMVNFFLFSNIPLPLFFFANNSLYTRVRQALWKTSSATQEFSSRGR